MRWSRPLVVYVAAVVTAGAVVAALTVPGRRIDWTAVFVVSTIALWMELSAIRIIANVRISWAPIGFLGVTASLVAGPPGALAASLAAGLGFVIRWRVGMARFLFNVADFFLYFITAWAVFEALTRGSAAPGLAVLAAVAAAIAGFAVNVALLAGVARLSEKTSIVVFVRESLVFISFSAGYGATAYAAFLLYDRIGVLGLALILIPVVLVQLSLIILGRRIDAEEQSRRAHAEEREALLRRALEASDTERRRVARDLHDSVVADITVLAGGIAGEAARTSDAHTAEFLRLAQMATRDAVGVMRSLMLELAPPQLAETGLARAIADILGPLEESGVAIELHIDDSIDRCPAVYPLYRIAQETLRNVFKHAGARTVTVRGSRDGDAAVLEIRDDGHGFDDDEAGRKRREGHLGLQVLRDVAIDAHGSVEIDSRPGAGTTVRARLPLS